MRYVVGVDGGGTKTVGLLADETGQVVAEARSSGANLRTHGELHIERVLDELLAALGAREREVAAFGIGLAGVSQPEEQAVIRGMLRRMGYSVPCVISHDAAIALAAGGRDFGIALLAGTGSIAYGIDPSGSTARASGRHFIADEGSAYWFGHEALRAVARAADGRATARC